MGEAGVGGSERRLSSAGWNFDDRGGEVAESEEVTIGSCQLAAARSADGAHSIQNRVRLLELTICCQVHRVEKCLRFV